MEDLFPLFKDYYQRQVLSKDYDYIVPIENTGMLFLKEIQLDSPRLKAQKLCRRAFDFIPINELETKRAALIDDMVLRGRNLNTSAEILKGRGLSSVSKYAFMLYEDEQTKANRRIDDISICTVLSPKEYEIVIDEINKLSTRTRPSSPDHFGLRISLSEYKPTEYLKQICEDAGITSEYKRSREFRTWTLHDPVFMPQLPDRCLNKGVVKIRVSVPYAEKYFEFVPNYFPILEIREDIDNKMSTLWQQFHNLLEREWHDEKTRLRNKYESLTLALRTELASNFINFLKKNKCPIMDFSILDLNLPTYYGKGATEQIKRIINGTIGDLTSWEKSASEKHEISFELPEEIDFPSVCEYLMGLLNQEYDRRNKGKDPYEREQAGLSIEEFTQLSNYPREIVCIAAEILNDYSYCAPMFAFDSENGKNFVGRKYRLTEKGSFKLKK